MIVWQTRSVDRRRLRSVRTRERLLAVALDLFESGEYPNITVDEIAAKAGVSARTFFHHFPSKEEVVFDGVTERLSLVIDVFRDQPADLDLFQALSATTRHIACSLIEQGDAFLRRNRLYEREPTLRATMLRINQEWVDQIAIPVAERLGLADDPLDRPHLVAAVFHAANRNGIRLWVAGGGRGSVEDMMLQQLELVRPAIQAIDTATHVA